MMVLGKINRYYTQHTLIVEYIDVITKVVVKTNFQPTNQLNTQ